MSNDKTRKRSMGKQSFLHGALILTIGMAIVKVVGALFKVPLTNVITSNGIGYFSTAYNFYGVIFSLATAGFPIAIAKLVAESYTVGRFNDVRQVLRVSTPIFVGLGALGTLAMFLGADAYAKSVNNPYSFVPILALAPSILFCCLSSIYRGYYEGLRNMYPTAISEIIEAVTKFVIGLSGAIATVFLLNREFEASGTIMGVAMEAETAVFSTYSYAAAAAILGVTCGTLLSFVYLIIYYKRRGDGITKDMYRSSPLPHSRKSVAKKLISIAIPIAIGSLTMSLAGIIDTNILQNRLGDIVAGDSAHVVIDMYRGIMPEINIKNPETIPNFLFGCYTVGLTVFMLVPSITQAFGISALPTLTDSWTRGDKKEIKASVESILRITCLFSIPAGLGITALAEPITWLLFSNSDGVQITARVLIILGIGAIFSALSTPLSSMLQAVGRVNLPVIFVTVALAIKIAINYILCGIPEINVLGAGTGTLVCYLFVTIAEVIALVKVTHVKINYKSTFIKPFICALACAASAYGTAYAVNYFGLGMKLACVAGVAVAVVVYVFLLFISKTISKIDVLMLPKGEKIAKLLEKRGWIG